MSGSLQNATVLVTGATGIAAATTRRFAAEGAAVFVASLEAEDCRALAAEIESGGGTCAWQATDLRDEASVEAVFATCRERFGRLDGTLAVVGGSGRRYGDGPAHEVTLEAWDATLSLNLSTAFLTGREAVRTMRRQEPSGSGGRGAVVFVTSVLGRYPAPEVFPTHAYATAKGALYSLTRSMAARYAPEGIRVNAIAPAAVTSPMSARAAADPETVAYVARRQPLAGGFLTPEHISGAAAFLLSADSRAVTGQVLAIDGGWAVTG